MHLGEPITSKSNARVKALRASFSGQASQPGDLLGLEGENLIREADFAGLTFETIYVREGSESTLQRFYKHQSLRAADFALLSRNVFDSAVSTASPQGIAAIWRIVEPVWPDRLPAGLVLEGLQDPGNLGTLIRSAHSFNGGTPIMVTPGTANQWNPKVVRASAGAVFRVPVQRAPLQEIASQLRAQGVRLFAAVAGFISGPEYGYPRMAAPQGVLTGRVENADAPDGLRYPNVLHVPTDAGEQQTYAASLSYDTDFLHPCAILIGNEGHGLSKEALALADERVLIPGSGESLNAGVAGSILLYEAMRQIPLRVWAKRKGLRP